MKLSTSINHKKRAEKEIRQLWRHAKSYRLSHDDVLKRKEKIFQSVAHCPGWVRHYLRGYDKCQFDMNYVNLELCYNLKGVLYSTDRESNRPNLDRLYKKGLGLYITKHEAHFHWKNSDKIFF